MKLFSKSHKTLMSKKFSSMLLSGTLTWMVVSILSMVDSIVAGVAIDSYAVAGVTLVTPIYSLSAFFGSLFSIGVPVLYTTEMDKFNKEKADQIFGTGMLLSILIGSILFILVNLCGEIYLCSSSPLKEVLSKANEYLYWMRFTILILPLQTFIGAMVLSDGDESIPNIANVIQVVGNIIFSIILSKLMGIYGIGLASFLFYAISIVILFLHFLKKNNSLRLNLYFSLDILKGVLHYSLINSSSYLFLSIFVVIVSTFVSTKYGPEYLILASAIMLCREFQVLFEGIGEAINPIFSVYVAEKNHKGLRFAYSLANKAAIIEGICVTIFLMLIAPFVPQVLNISDPMLIHTAIIAIRLVSLNSIFVSLLYLLTSYYLVIEHITLGLVVCAMRDVVLSIAFIIILGGVFNLTGMLVGIAIAPAIAYILLMIYITLRYGSKDCPLLLSQVEEAKNYYLFNISTRHDEIISMQKEIEMILNKHSVNKRTISETMLLIEEMYVLISQMNNNKEVFVECTVFVHPDGIQIISKDDGVSFDMADENISTKSLSAYTVSMYLEKKEFTNRHLTTMSFNCNSFFIN